ncbi:hypothetical protein [Peterkaempfera griseoplana]|uniref:hypothetical protein n=1 Tax=Peterkaempfera griseoplana TaxID=66896 RepID=UPI0006E37285|nr:hypothetical protein [Peterkaempfera griseoplana]
MGLALVLAGGGSFAYWAYDKVSGAGSYRLLPPAEFQGLSRSGNEQHEQVLKDALAKQWEQNRDTRGKFTPMAAVYGTAPRQFTVWGGSGRIAGSAEGPDQGLDAAARGGVLLGTRRTMDPGPLGGTLKCAPVEVQTRTVGICAWSDSSTVVMVLDASGPDGGDLEATAERIRAYRSLTEIAE